MSFLSTLFGRFQNLSRQTAGNALVISVITVSALSLTTIGVAVLVVDSAEGSVSIERSTKAYFASESAGDAGRYDLAMHLDGYTVNSSTATYNRFSFGNGGSVEWIINDRARIISASDTQDQTIYGSGFDGYMVYPRRGHGDSDDGNWMRLSPGKTSEFRMYVDNTSEAVHSGGATQEALNGAEALGGS